MKFNLDKIDLKKYKRQGVDISILRANLEIKNPEERILNHQKMLALVEEAKKARMRNLHDQFRNSS